MSGPEPSSETEPRRAPSDDGGAYGPGAVALRRVVAGAGVEDLVSILADLPAPDLTTLLLAVSARRVGG